MMRKCENPGCSNKMEIGKNSMYQRSDKNGKQILVCQRCADKMDGISRKNRQERKSEDNED